MTGTDQQLFPKWLIRSKVYPTAQQVDILDRPVLQQTLDNGLNGRLSLVHAPAGYGKSTLITNWRDQLLARGIKVCWLSLDREDNDALQLLTYLAFSLSEAGISLAAADIDSETLLKDLSPRNLLSLLTHIIAAQAEKVVIVLDDFENLESATVEAAVQPLLNYAPDNLHLVIGTRNDAHLQISTLSAKGLASRLSAEDLKFNQRELADLFPQETPPAALKQIYLLTEGWPVAVQMIRITLDRQRDFSAIVEQLSRQAGTISAYLSEQVFNNLHSAQQQFLMDIALLRQVDCDFVNYLRDRQDSLALFNDLQHLNALIQPLDSTTGGYRLHPLFRDYLYEKLSITDPQRKLELHQRTADWFSGRGDIVNAVRHSLLAKNPDGAVAVIERAGGLELWLKEGLSRFRAIFALLDDTTASASPRLSLIQCLLETKDGRVHQARMIFDKVKNHYVGEPGDNSQQATNTLRNEIMLMDSTLSLYEGKQIPDAACQALIEKTLTTDPAAHSSLSHHYTLLCLAHVQRGMFKEARRYAELAIPQFRKIKSLYGEAYIYFHLGDICFAEGKSQEAEQYYRTGLDITRRHFNDDRSMRLVPYVFLAELHYELNQLNSLSGAIESIPKQLEEREAWFDIYAAGYITSSNLEFHKYGIDAAQAVLDRALQYATEQQLTRLIDLLTCQRIELLIRAGDYAQAGALLEQSTINLDTYRNPDAKEFAWRERDAAVHSIIRLMIKDGRYDQALRELDHFATYAKSYSHIRSSIKYAILQSLAHHRKGEYNVAGQYLDNALALTEKSGFIRSVIDEGEDVRALLHTHLQLRKTNHPQIEAMLRHFDGPREQPGEALLSKREMQIMQQLNQGFSNKVIARNIAISENTVRFHLKNIFNKLHVDSRLQAVTVAKKRKLI